MKVLIIPGSVRPNSVGAVVTEQVRAVLEAKENVEIDVADLRQLNLPYYDAPLPPSMEGYTIPHESVQAWSDQVTAADAVIFVMPEYNHGMTAVQKNAIDWLYAEWSNKPTAIVAYGFYGGKHSIEAFMSINNNIKLDLRGTPAQLTLGAEIAPDGTIANPELVTAAIQPAVDALLEK